MWKYLRLIQRSFDLLFLTPIEPFQMCWPFFFPLWLLPVHSLCPIWGHLCASSQRVKGSPFQTVALGPLYHPFGQLLRVQCLLCYITRRFRGIDPTPSYASDSRAPALLGHVFTLCPRWPAHTLSLRALADAAGIPRCLICFVKETFPELMAGSKWPTYISDSHFLFSHNSPGSVPGIRGCWEMRIHNSHICSAIHGTVCQMGRWNGEAQRFPSVPPGAQSSCLSVLTERLHSSCFSPFPRAFLFPSDQQIDLELWAEQAEFDCTELHQMRVQDNCIFSISPKAGSLSPGQEQAVEFKYRCSPTPPSLHFQS